MSTTAASETPASPATELTTAVATAGRIALASTVRIGRDGRGSGVIIEGGLVLTNAHHLRDKTVQVTFADGRVAQAEVRGVDADGDLAVVAPDPAVVSAGAPLAGLAWADEAPAIGAFVVAAHGAGRISFGIVAATGQSFRGPRGRRIIDGFEHTAPLPRGASGGPVVDLTGALLGLDTNRTEAGYQAISSTPALRERVARLATGTDVERRSLGIALAPNDTAGRVRRAAGLPEIDGLLVRGVAEGSPAGAAGLREGDVLVARGADRIALRTIDDLHRALDEVGESGMILHVVRGVEERTVTVTFPSSSV